MESFSEYSPPVRLNLFKFIPFVSQELWSCPTCNGPQETVHHIFLGCPLTKSIWRNPYMQNGLLTLVLSKISLLSIESWTKVLLWPRSILSIPYKFPHEFQVSAAIINGLHLGSHKQ